MRRDDGMQMPRTDTQAFPLLGGLDTETSQLARKPGVVMAASNYEANPHSGYERIGGFEGFDGRPRPSDAVFRILQADVAFTGVAVGNTINGQTSSATAKVLQLRGTKQLVVTRVTGAFVLGETLRVGVTGIGLYIGDADDYNSLDQNAFATLAAADYRADIQAVPGSGSVRGVAALGSTVYAFRDNVGGTALAIYRSSAGGWVNVPLMRELGFTAGSGTPPLEGAVVTKGGVTAIVRRVVLQSGTFASSTAAGRLIVDTVLGGPFTAGSFTGGMTATVSGADTAIALLPGGRLDHRVFNFTASADANRIYGCDGVNRGFEFDGNVLVPIATGMVPDTPRHVEVHRDHLFFSFRGSVQHSGIKRPYEWTVLSGAGELAAGDEVTGFNAVPGDADNDTLLATTATRTLILYGTSSENFRLVSFNPYVGAQRWSLQNIGNPLVFDANGVTLVTQSQDFGNFIRTPMSDRLRTFLKNRTVTASVVDRTTTRARLFFADGSGLSITPQTTPQGEILAFMPISYGKTVRCACEAQIGGVHRNFFGSDDGFVYEADRGRNFHGASITAWAKLAFNHTKSPLIKKRMRSAAIEAKGQSAFKLKVQGEYSLGDIEIGTTDVLTLQNPGGAGGRYDVTNYDECFYDTPSQTLARARLDGTGTSLSLTLFSEADDELPHLLQSVTTAYTQRRMERG